MKYFEQANWEGIISDTCSIAVCVGGSLKGKVIYHNYKTTWAGAERDATEEEIRRFKHLKIMAELEGKLNEK